MPPFDAGQHAGELLETRKFMSGHEPVNERQSGPHSRGERLVLRIALQRVHNGLSTTVYMTADEFSEVYHLLQTESPVFSTTLNLFGLEVGAVHTELDLGAGEPPGEGDEDHTQSLAALIR